MHWFVPDEQPVGSTEEIEMKPGARVVIVLGILTIATAVSFHQFLHLPPFLGMMLGLGILMMFGYVLKKSGEKTYLTRLDRDVNTAKPEPFDIFRKVEAVEFDTLLFFFGVLTAVGALQYIGYLALVSQGLYGTLGPTPSNIVVGVLSAVVDNIPVMYGVIKMDPQMGLDQWLLITLTTGVGGSLLSVGSAAGVAVMGVDRKNYTFMAHLKWAPVIALGYIFSILAWWVLTQNLR
jgi:Na+/H+ antiporter NhaD/arsenite permease-like protein